MLSRLRLLGVCLAALAATCALAQTPDEDEETRRARDQDPLSVDAKHVFQSRYSVQGALPIRVTVQNEGPDTRGTVSVRAPGFSMLYPVELPRGSKKSFVAYVTSLDQFVDTVTVSLNTNRGSPLPMVLRNEMSYSEGPRVALVADKASGLLGFLTQDQRGASQVLTAEAKPTELPDRVIGYDRMSAVVLSEGAERITDAELDTLKDYMLLGGTVVIVGGASVPILKDPRWQELMPIRSPRSRVLRSSPYLRQLGGADVPSEFSITTGDLAPGATAKGDAGVPLIAERRIGAGKLVYFALNPLEAPLDRWEGRRKAVLSILKFDQRSDVRQVLANPMGAQRGGVVFTSSGGYYPYEDPTREDSPFNAEMPAVTSVAGILVLYFVLVVPVNLLLLRKLKRGEWAWITAPVLSLAFAGVFFRYASHLYSASQSTATTGWLVYDDLANRGYFIGKTQMFFPRGGNYDLKFDGIQAIYAERDYGYEYNGYGYQEPPTRAGTLDKMNPVDTGEIKVPAMNVTNLSFEEFRYEQHVSAEKWLSADMSIGGGFASGTIRNGSPYPIRDAKLVGPGYNFWLGTLEPGETKTLSKVRSSAVTEQEWEISVSSVLARQIGASETLLVGSLDRFRPGPQIGTDLESERDVRIAAFLHGVKQTL